MLSSFLFHFKGHQNPGRHAFSTILFFELQCCWIPFCCHLVFSSSKAGLASGSFQHANLAVHILFVLPSKIG